MAKDFYLLQPRPLPPNHMLANRLSLQLKLDNSLQKTRGEGIEKLLEAIKVFGFYSGFFLVDSNSQTLRIEKLLIPFVVLQRRKEYASQNFELI